MISDSIFDILMETRKVDKQISEQQLKLANGKREVLSLKQDIFRVRDLQLKAVTILNNTEMSFQDVDNTLNCSSQKYHKLINKLAYIEVETNKNSDLTKELTRQKQEMSIKLVKVRAEKRVLARKLNDIDIQLTLQRKKNAAVFQERKHQNDKAKHVNVLNDDNYTEEFKTFI